MGTNEKSSLIRAIAALGLVLASPVAFAQTCTEGAGLTNITSTTSGHSAVGQSFTADCAGGEITAITIVWDTGGTSTGIKSYFASDMGVLLVPDTDNLVP